MRSDYIHTRSHYYGPNLGCTYEHGGGHKDLRHVPPPPIFFPLPSQSLVLPIELKELSQLSGETRETIVDSRQMSLASAHVALDGGISRPPPFLHDPPVPLYGDAFLLSLLFDQLLIDACMYHDVIHETWRMHELRGIDRVHIYTKLLTLIVNLCITIYINCQFILDFIYINKFMITCKHDLATWMSL